LACDWLIDRKKQNGQLARIHRDRYRYLSLFVCVVAASQWQRKEDTICL